MRKFTSHKILVFHLLIILVLTFLTNKVIYAADFQKIEVIKSPKPNVFEQEYVQLNELRTISGDLGGENFLFLPISMDIDNNDNIYVFDQFESKIFKLTRDFKLIKTFLREGGQGPGEIIRKGGLSSVSIHIGRNGKLYVNNKTGFKIMEFDLDGNFIHEQKFKLAFRNILVSEDGNYYLQSKDNGIIDVFNKDFDYVDTLLNTDENRVYLFHKPKAEQMRFLIATNFWGQYLADLSLDSILIVYLKSSSKVYLFKDKEIINEFYIYPKTALEWTNKYAKEKETHLSIFSGIFVDRDDKNCFYFTHLMQRKSTGRISIYKFNLKGELMKVLYIDDSRKLYPKIQFKKNGIFYALADEKIILYKEANQ